MMTTSNRCTRGAAFQLTLYMIIGLHIASHSHAQAAGTRCETRECFLEQAALCIPATFDTQFVAGGQARYKVYGPSGKPDECFIDFKFLKNPDPVLVGPFFSFVVQTRQALEPQLKEGVTDCLEGRQGKYNCSGPLWDLVFESNKVEIRMATDPPCGVVVEDEGPPLYPLPRDGKWGYVTRSGEWAIEPQWANAKPFSEGRAAVAGGSDSRGPWGIIDRSGQYVLEPILESVRPFSEGCASASNTESNREPFRKYFFVARDGSFWHYDKLPEGATEQNFQGFGDFSQGKAWFYNSEFRSENEYGWIDTTGKVVIPRQYSRAGNFVAGLAPAAQGGDYWALMDDTGKARVPDRWRFKKMGPVSEGLVAINIDVFTWYYMSRDGIAITKIVLKHPERQRKGVAGEHNIIQKAGAFHDGLAPVEPKWGYLGDERLMFIRPDGSEAFAPGRDLKLRICSSDPLPEYENGLVGLQVANDGKECGEWKTDRAYHSNAHYVYLDTAGKIVLEQPWREGDTDALP